MQFERVMVLVFLDVGSSSFFYFVEQVTKTIALKPYCYWHHTTTYCLLGMRLKCFGDDLLMYMEKQGAIFLLISIWNI